jgi:hypothetical protein
VAIADTLAPNVDMLFDKAVAGTPLKSSDAGYSFIEMLRSRRTARAMAL